MKNTIKLILWLFVFVLMITACAPSTATVAPATAVNNPTQPAYVPPSGGASATATPAGYPAPAATADVPAAAQNGYPAPGTINVELAGNEVKVLAADALQALARQKITIDGSEIQALSLASALQTLGLTTYDKLVASGGGQVLELTKEQVAQAYLDLQGNGTIRLLVQGMPQSAWLQTLSTIQIQ